MVCWPLCCRGGSTSDSRPFSYRIQPHGHMYFVKELLCSHTLSFIVQLELKWLRELMLPGDPFKYANNEPPGIRLPEVWSRMSWQGSKHIKRWEWKAWMRQILLWLHSFKDTETESVNGCINQLLINPIFQRKHPSKLALHEPESGLQVEFLYIFCFKFLLWLPSIRYCNL